MYLDILVQTSSSLLVAAFPIQADAPQPVMHSREPDVSVFIDYIVSGEIPVHPCLVVEMDVGCT